MSHRGEQGGEAPGLPRSQSLVQGLFGWMSPFRHGRGDTSMEEDDDGEDTFAEASEGPTPEEVVPAPTPSPDVSLRSNPSPYARRPWTPKVPPSPSASMVFHPGSFETPTKRTPVASVPFSTSPFSTTRNSPGRRHAPIYFGPGTSTRKAHSPLRSTIPATHSMSAIPREPMLTTPEKRRKTQESTEASSVAFEKPAEEPEVPVRRSTRAASAMRQVLDSMQPVAPPAAPKPAVPEVVNPYQTRSKSTRPSRPTLSTRAKALEAARQRASKTASPPPEKPSSLLDVVERTEPRRSSRLSTQDTPLWHVTNKPKRPSPLAMNTLEQADADVPASGSMYDTIPPSMSDASLVPQLTSRLPKSATARDVSTVAKRPRDTVEDVAGPTPSEEPKGGTESQEPKQDPTPVPAPQPAPAPSPARVAAPAAAPVDVPSWCIVTPPTRREMPKGLSEDQIQALNVPYNDLAVFSFDVAPAKCDGTFAQVPSSTLKDTSKPLMDAETKSASFATEAPKMSSGAQPFSLKGAGEVPKPAATPAFGSTETTPSFTFGTQAQPSSEAPKPSFTFGASAKPSSEAPKPSFTFGAPAKPSSEASKPSFSFGASAKPSSEASKPSFTFGAQATSSSSEAPKPSFSFGASAKPSFTFGASTKPSVESTETKSSGNAVKPSFSFSSQAPVAPSVPSSVPAAETSSDAGAPDTNALTSQGQGEEDETTSHEVRSKIWRLDGGQWQDMGVCILRIKTSKETSKSRVLARNAVNGNVVLNFALYEGLRVTCEKSVLLFLGFVDAKPCNLRCKVKTNEAAESLKEALMSHVNH